MKWIEQSETFRNTDYFVNANRAQSDTSSLPRILSKQDNVNDAKLGNDSTPCPLRADYSLSCTRNDA